MFFSIIVPCYNQGHFLKDCLNSIISQTYSNWEVIVVNDGSTDCTSDIVRIYMNSDNRFRLVEKPNGGLSSARNAGIRAAKGDWLLFLDSDDFLSNDCLELIQSVSSQVNEFTWIQYGYTYISEDLQTRMHTVSPKSYEHLIPQIFLGSPGPCHTICISKKLCNAIGGFDEQLKSVEDWDFWIRAAKCGALQYTIHKSLAFYRYVPQSMSRNPFVMYDAFERVATRSILHDVRININSPLNINYDFDLSSVLEQSLVRFLGISVMQNKINEAVDYFKEKTKKDVSKYTPDEFASMCSYLTFRYMNNNEEVKSVLTNIYPRFDGFFKLIGYNYLFRKRALYIVFKMHIHRYNHYRYGFFWGRVINFILTVTHKTIL